MEKIDHLKFNFIKNGIKAEAHSPIYKMHKYFARRPHNVFRFLIESYTNKNDIVLDLFCGGGVSVFEGLAINRKVIGVDINPLATYISEMQTTELDVVEYLQTIKEIKSKLALLTNEYFTTTNRITGKKEVVKWNELCYTVKCPNCSGITALSNKYKLNLDGKVKNGFYSCEKCKYSFKSVDAERYGTKIISVTYQSKDNERITVEPSKEDILTYDLLEKNFETLVNKDSLWYPNNLIPPTWDRQKEDCLNRKGVYYFSDFFTKRNLYIMSFYFRLIKEYKDKVSLHTYKYLLFTFSAVLRFTNNLTISTESWMDGRPVAWAKHAFWISNQFVEVNPIEYIDKRSKAVIQGATYFKSQNIKSRKVDSFNDLVKFGTHIIWTKSSDKLKLPDASVDAIITDPPYGGNVQYGELSAFWLVWLKLELGLSDEIFTLKNEVLVHRKKHLTSKDFKFYYDSLLGIFKEGYRVLKPNRPLAFTFNNKDLRSWFAVIKAAVDAGFYLDDKGVIYQEPIENYKNTAHTRFAGSLHGDFIYTFLKVEGASDAKFENVNLESLSNKIYGVVEAIINSNDDLTVNEVYVQAFSTLMPIFVRSANDEKTFNAMVAKLEGINIETLVNQLKAKAVK